MPPTPYRIYLNEKLREGFEKDLDPKDVKAKASQDWKMMSEEDRNVYKERKIINDNWFEEAKNIRKVTPLSMFIQKVIDNARDRHKEVPTLTEIVSIWKKLTRSDKAKYN